MRVEDWAHEIVRWRSGVGERGGRSRMCVGLTRVGRPAISWVRCGKRSMRGESLCATHRDALNGAVLGILQREQTVAEKKVPSRGCFPCAGHTRSRGGKTDVPATRPGPGVSVSCSPLQNLKVGEADATA